VSIYNPNAPRKLSTPRVRLWRARQREKARLAKIAVLDVKRIAKGKLPLKEANLAKQAKFQAKKKALQIEVRKMWFAPEISYESAIGQTAARNTDWDASFVRSLVDGYVRACRGAGVSLNEFSMQDGAHRANHARVVFHELIAAGVSLSEAAQRCHLESFKPNESLSGVLQSLDTIRRFEAAQDRWGFGNEIGDALLGPKRRLDALVEPGSSEESDFIDEKSSVEIKNHINSLL
jgi:hypothetical protein